MKRKTGIDSGLLKECGKWAEADEYLIVADEESVVIKCGDVAYFGTRDEYYNKFGKEIVQDLYALLAKKEKVRFCLECGAPIYNETDVYCDKCREEATKRDNEALRNFDIGNESKDTGFYALAGAIMAEAQREYMKVLFLLYKNPYDEALLKRLKLIEEELTVAAINDARNKTRRLWLKWIYREMKELEREERKSEQRKG